jgi:hypothetical protein
MSTTDKNFKVKNGLDVAGTATFESDIVLGTAPIAFDSQTGRLKIQVNDIWMPIAFREDILDVTFMDLNLAIDYNGNPIYTVQSNGVTAPIDSKLVDAGSPADNTPLAVFDSGVLV